jgi:hypothetical protein
MKIKEIWNPKFKQLDAMPQALWLMYPTMEDRKTHEFDYSLATLTGLTGHSRTTIIKANKDLEDHKIISRDTAHRQTTTYTLKEKPRLTNLDIKNGVTSFILIDETKPKELLLSLASTPKNISLCPDTEHKDHSLCPDAEHKEFSIWTPSIDLSISRDLSKTTTHGPALKSYMELLNEEDVVEEPVVVFKESVKKENESIADWLKAIKAYWIDVTSVESFIRQFNKEKVYHNIDVIAKKNEIENKKGYLIKILREDIWLPYPKTEAYTKEKHNKSVDDQIEKRRQEQKKWEEDRQKDYDPEKPKKYFGNFLATLPEA